MSRQHGPLIIVVREWPAPSEAFVQEQVRALIRQGHEVLVWALRRSSNTIDDPTAWQDALLQVRYLWPQRVAVIVMSLTRGLLRWPVRSIRLLWEALAGDHPSPRQRVKTLLLVMLAIALAEQMREGERPLRFHAHFAYGGALVARVVAGLLKAPYSLTVHNSDVYRPQGLLALKLTAADRIVTISDRLRRDVLTLYPFLRPSSVQTIRLGVDTHRFCPSTTGRNDNAPVRLLTVARMTHEKDPFGVVTAAHRLHEAGYRFVWRWIGDGPLMAAVREAVDGASLNNRLDLIGWVPNYQLSHYYRQADIFILGSRFEGLPVVLMEAMASGLAVVATRLPGILELIDSEQNGLLVPPEDPDALASAVTRLIHDPDLRRRLVTAARTTVEQQFDLFTNSERLWSVLADTNGNQSVVAAGTPDVVGVPSNTAFSNQRSAVSFEDTPNIPPLIKGGVGGFHTSGCGQDRIGGRSELYHTGTWRDLP